MIIWLASYPKSGNTLLRAMLSAYLFSSDGFFNFKLLKNIKQFPNDDILKRLNINSEDKNEIIKHSIRAQETFNKKKSVGFVKTHNMLFNYKKKYPFTNLENTLGVIYVVRDPRNVVISYSRHLDTSINETVKFVTLGKGNKNDIMGNWSENYNSWKVLGESRKYLLIKYEELTLHRKETFLKILKFIFELTGRNLSLDNKKLNNVIQSTSLDSLKKLERNSFFDESMKDKKGRNVKFFDQGDKRDWSKTLDYKISDQLETVFKDEMVELGYL